MILKIGTSVVSALSIFAIQLFGQQSPETVLSQSQIVAMKEKIVVDKSLLFDQARQKLMQYRDAFMKAQSQPEKIRALKKYAWMLASSEYNYSWAEWKKVDLIWTQESQWDWKAINEDSGAFGITQSMSPAVTFNPFVQIRLGLKYIDHRYASGFDAYNFKMKHGWY